MKKIALNDRLSVSRLAYGMWRLSEDVDTSVTHVQAKIEACLAQGITTFDQADIYGGYEAEEILGNVLRANPGLREQMELVTKCSIIAPVGRHSTARTKYYDTGRDHLTQSVEASLRLMGTDHIELLLIHRPDPMLDHCETGKALDDLVASGKVGSVGVSNFKLHDWELLQSGMTTQLATNQIEMSLMANDAFTNGDLAGLQQRGIAPMAWSPLAGGALFDPANAALLTRLDQIGAEFETDGAATAIAWLLAHPANIIPVLGTNKLDRIARISDANRVTVDRQTWFELYQLANGSEVP